LFFISDLKKATMASKPKSNRIEKETEEPNTDDSDIEVEKEEVGKVTRVRSSAVHGEYTRREVMVKKSGGKFVI
jgi:hypothetical protein